MVDNAVVVVVVVAKAAAVVVVFVAVELHDESVGMDHVAEIIVLVACFAWQASLAAVVGMLVGVAVAKLLLILRCMTISTWRL